MKIVINKCYGGFGLSHDAYLLYAKKAGITLYTKKEEFGQVKYFTSPEQTCEIYDFNIERNDPLLVETVEELGTGAASGRFAKLRVVEIPDGVGWELNEYDGMETVREYSRSWD